MVGNGYIPGRKLMVLLHELHNLLEALLFLNVEAVTELLFVLPIVHHFCLDWPTQGVASGNARCAMRVLVRYGTVVGFWQK